MTSEHGGFSPFVAICFTINYIMGTGFLSLPWAFIEGGVIASTIALILVVVIADLSKDYILETMARADAIVHLSEDQSGIRKLTSKDTDVYSAGKVSPIINVDETGDDGIDDDHEGGRKYRYSCRMHDMRHYGSITDRQDKDGDHPILYSVRDRTFEIPELCRIFLGNTAAQIYTICVSIYIYLSSWAFTTVFASALAKELPIFGESNENLDYAIYVFQFSIIVVPLACRELKEQVTVQIILAACRLLMVTLMVITVILLPDEIESDSDSTSTPYEIDTKMGTPLFHLARLYHTVPIIVYAFIFHHSIPGLSSPVADKRKLKYIFRSTLVISALGYTFVGLCVGIHFGSNVYQSANLNWKDFRGGTGEMIVNYDDEGNIVDHTWINIAWWAKAISFFIVSFPALDAISIFPLGAITLGNNLLDAFYCSDRQALLENTRLRTKFRLIASIPPIICALFVRKLGIITDYAGAVGFVMAFSYPALLYLSSKKRIDGIFHTVKGKNGIQTYYQGYGSNNSCAILICFFGIGMTMFVLACLSLDG